MQSRITSIHLNVGTDWNTNEIGNVPASFIFLRVRALIISGPATTVALKIMEDEDELVAVEYSLTSNFIDYDES